MPSTATCLDFAKISWAVYFTGPNSYIQKIDPGHRVDGFECTSWREGSLFGPGFQGGIYQSEADVIVGCCGTNKGQLGKFVKDVVDDLGIALRITPSQVGGAREVIRMAKKLATGGRRVSVTGHSLGGGLAQLAGMKEGVPFVTFNAPAMGRVGWLGAAHNPLVSRDKRHEKLVDSGGGLNFRIRGESIDPVSIHGAAGSHLGTVVDLEPRSGGFVHGKDVCLIALQGTDWADISPFERLGKEVAANGK